MFALKIAKAAGLKVILSSSSDQKLKTVSEQFPEPSIVTVNYVKNPNWHEDVLKHTNGVGVEVESSVKLGILTGKSSTTHQRFCQH